VLAPLLLVLPPLLLPARKPRMRAACISTCERAGNLGVGTQGVEVKGIRLFLRSGGVGCLFVHSIRLLRQGVVMNTYNGPLRCKPWQFRQSSARCRVEECKMASQPAVRQAFALCGRGLRPSRRPSRRRPRPRRAGPHRRRRAGISESATGELPPRGGASGRCRVPREWLY
jgi:hypothetical protein